MCLTAFVTGLFSLLLLCLSHAAEPPVPLGNRRELMVDRYLIDTLQNLQFTLHEPRDEGCVLKFDAPWEGPFSGYSTIIQDGSRLRVYYRGLPKAGRDGSSDEVTCVAESEDGRHWSKPKLGLFEVQGSRENNVILANAAPASHNFSPFLDARPNVPADERYKALAGLDHTGLFAYISADGLRWKKLGNKPVITRQTVPFPFRFLFDAQNLAFWSISEQCYVSYFRVFGDVRRIGRTTSKDFVNWTPAVLMEYRLNDGNSFKPAPLEELYTNQTFPYFRAPHIYLATAARFMPGRRVLTDDQAKAIHVDPAYFKDTSDAILLSTRGGSSYDRTFPGAFIRPGIGAQNWVSRTNYPALNMVQTGPAEMSRYVNQDYAQPTAHLRRYSMRLDGLASLRASYAGGEMVTKPLTFAGKQLMINFQTSAAGGIRVEIQDEKGTPMEGYTLKDAVETIGNEIERTVRWKHGADVRRLAGRTVRLRFVMKDADLFALRFAE
jgi:hypothetical protein